MEAKAICAICPVREICLEHAIDPTPLNPIVARSQDFLPTAKLPSLDLVLIDGDHSFEWAWADYVNVGRNARVCAFHDVNNAPYREMHLGGVCALWEKVKQSEGGDFREFFEHPSREIMGIGVRTKKDI